MSKVIFQPKKDESEIYGAATVTGNGGYVLMDSDSYNKYVAKTNAAGNKRPDTDYKAKLQTVSDSLAQSGIDNKTVTEGKPTPIPDNSNTVAIRDYTASKGLSDIVDWDGEKVTVGGRSITPLYVQDGTAYVSRQFADDIINSIKSEAGIHGNDYAEKLYEKKYGKAIDAALDAVLEREPFSYNPETDAVYNAYRNQYEREADAAYRRVLNDNNTSVTGASGAVLAEAAASRNDYLSKITDMIPQLANDAYSRYNGETDRLNGALKNLADIAGKYYERSYQRERDSYNDLIASAAAESKEKQRHIENHRIDEQNRIQNEQTRINNEYTNAEKAANTAKKNIELRYYPAQLESEITNTRAKTENYTLENAQTRGFFTRSDEAALPWLSAYRTAYGYSINPQLAAAALEYEKAHSKKQGELAAEWGW